MASGARGRTRRSQLSKALTHGIGKLICAPMIKSHGSGGVTLWLKNMLYGLVNNGTRNHAPSDTDSCNLFIPAVVAHPVIRNKAVRQVLDGLNAVFRGTRLAEGVRRQYEAWFFATGPVELDRIGWDADDARRSVEGLPPVSEAGKRGEDPTGTENFDHRQTDHIAGAATFEGIAGAAALKLGVYDQAKIDHGVVRFR